MNRPVFIVLAIVIVATGCTSKKTTEYTVLGDIYTPYWCIPERIIGRVEKVVEKYYWAVPEGGTYKKANLITLKDLDSLTLNYDFEAIFDKSGDLVSCNQMDENNKSLDKWELVKENNIIVTAKEILNDTVSIYQKFKYSRNREIVEISEYRAMVDTLLKSFTIKSSEKKDTITHQFFNYKGIPFVIQFYLYNDEGQFLRRDSYNNEGAFLYANEVKYNEKGKISELMYYDKDKKVSACSHYTYEYDNTGNWIKAIVKDENGRVIFEERVYSYFE